MITSKILKHGYIGQFEYVLSQTLRNYDGLTTNFVLNLGTNKKYFIEDMIGTKISSFSSAWQIEVEKLGWNTEHNCFNMILPNDFKEENLWQFKEQVMMSLDQLGLL